jgi:putative ABC transport system permease protein
VITPLLAAAFPVISGSRLTVNQAINTYGLSAKPTLLDRAFSQTRRVPRLLVLMLTNTFRKKGRVILTQISLVLSGLIFMMVMSARDSTAYTFSDVIFSILNFNVNFLLEDAERINRIEEMTLEHPDVKAVEMWGLNSGAIRLQGEPATDDDESVVFFGVPLPTELYGPQIRGGRWLLPEDTYAVVLNQRLAHDAGIDVGDWVTVDHGPSGEADWLVVGLLFDIIIPNTAHAPRDVLLREIGSAGRSSSVWIQTVREDPESEVAAAKSIRAFYEERGIDVDPAGIFNADTSSEITAQVLDQFGIIITLLLVMAILIGLVGSIALSGVLSLNVLERRREIGVMRAVGASDRSVGLLFVGEGLILGLLSWLIALPLSIPAGQIMVQAIGQAVDAEIVYKFTPVGALLWLVIIIVLSIAASWLPARSAIRISVRQSLAYQ